MRVAILGAGYAGLSVARRLETALPPDVELVVVDENGEHLLRHELHRVIRRPAVADELVVPLGSLLDRATVRRASVSAVDPADRRISLDNGTEVAYDYAAVCLGSKTDFAGMADIEARSTPLEGLPDARRIRRSFLELPPEGRTLVCGAGLTGIQVAGELAALARERGLDRNVVLLERLDDVAPSFPANFQAAVRDELETREIDVRTGTAVVGATDDVVEVEAGTIPYDQLIWVGGIRGSTALSGSRPEVRGDLRLDNRTFVVGDAARVIDRDGEAVPASAQAAVAAAETAATNIRRLVEADRDGDGLFEPRLSPFDFEAAGWIVSIGDGAVAQVGPTVLRGASAHALKASVGAGYLSSVGGLGDAVKRLANEFS